MDSKKRFFHLQTRIQHSHYQFFEEAYDRNHKDYPFLVMCSHGRCWDNQTWWQFVASREWLETIPFAIAGHAVLVVSQSGSRNSRSGPDELPKCRLLWTENVQEMDKDIFPHHVQAERVTQGLKVRFSRKICHSIANNTVNLNGRIKNQKKERTSTRWSSRSW